MIIIYMEQTLDYAVKLNPELINDVIQITTKWELKAINGISYYKNIINDN